MDKRLADLLVSSELQSRAEIQRKILKSKALKKGVLAQVFESGVDENTLADLLCEYLGTTRIDNARFEINPTALKFLSKKMAEKAGVLPFRLSDSADNLSVAIYDPEYSEQVMETLQTATGNKPIVFLAKKSWLRSAIRFYYFGEEWSDKPTPKAQTFQRKKPASEAARSVPRPKNPPLARVKPKRRTILTPIEMKPALGEKQSIAEESEEIVLEELSFGWEVSDVEEEKPAQKPAPEKTQRKRKRATTQNRKNTKPGSMVDRALNDFDAFLDSHAGPPKQMVDPNLSDIPGWTSPPSATSEVSGENGSPFGSWSEDEGNGFDLFSEPEEDSDIHEVMKAQTLEIGKLKADLSRQKNIIQALIDILSESKVVSKREIKKRISRR